MGSVIAARISFLVVGAFLLTATTAWSDVPHRFFAGRVADADEVNDNFAYLERRIDALQPSQSNKRFDQLDSNQLIGANSFQTIDGLNTNITTSGGDVLVTVSMVYYLQAQWVWVRPQLDGIDADTRLWVQPADINGSMWGNATGMFVFRGVAPGTHTVTVTAATDTSSVEIAGVFSNSNATALLVEEI